MPFMFRTYVQLSHSNDPSRGRMSALTSATIKKPRGTKKHQGGGNMIGLPAYFAWSASKAGMRGVLALAAGAVLLAASPASAQKKYDSGASDTEIKIGQTMPYSGPVSSFSTSARIASAYYKMLNHRGGVNGRKITMISLDDGYSPPKTVEQTRRLVEQGEGLALFGSLGTPTNVAVRKYLNQRKNPHLFVASNRSPRHNPPDSPPCTTPFPH